MKCRSAVMLKFNNSRYYTLPVIGILLVISIFLNNILNTSVILSLILSVIVVVISRLAVNTIVDRYNSQQGSARATDSSVYPKVGLGLGNMHNLWPSYDIGLGLEEGRFLNLRRKFVNHLQRFVRRDLTTEESINSNVISTTSPKPLVNGLFDLSSEKLVQSRSLSLSPITQTDSRNEVVDKHHLSTFTTTSRPTTSSTNNITFGTRPSASFTPHSPRKQDPLSPIVSQQLQQAMYSPRSCIHIRKNAGYSHSQLLSPSSQSSMNRRTVSAFRNFPTQEKYPGSGLLSSLQASPRVLNRTKSVQSPVTVRIASPDVVRSPSPLLRRLDAEVKEDPCSKESVLSAIRQCRKRTVHSEKDDSDISITEVKGNKTKRRRYENSGVSTPASFKTSTSDIICNGEVTKKMDVDESQVSTCHGIVSKTPRNAISSSFSSSKPSSNQKKRLFIETVDEEDEVVVPSKKFIHPLKERKLQHISMNEASGSKVNKNSNQSPKRQLGGLSKSETEFDGRQKLKRSQGHRKMPAFSAMENSTFLPPSTPYEFTAKDLAETRYQAEERVKLLRQELKENEEQEQSKLTIETKDGASGNTVGAKETASTHINTSSASVKGLSHLTSLIKEQSQTKQPVSSATTITSTGLSNVYLQQPNQLSAEQTISTSGSSLPGLNLQGLTKPSVPLHLLSNQSKSSTLIQSSSPLVTPSLCQTSGTESTGGIGSVSSAPSTSALISSTQLPSSTFNFGGSTKNKSKQTLNSTPGFQFGQTTPAKSVTSLELSGTNVSVTPSLSSGFNFGSKDSSSLLSNQSQGGTRIPGLKISNVGGQAVNVGGTGDGANLPSTIPPVNIGVNIGGINNVPDFSKTSGSVTGKASMSSNIFGTPKSTAGPTTSFISSQAATSSPFQFSSTGNSDTSSGTAAAAPGIFPFGAGNNSSQSQKNSFKPIFGDASTSKPSSVTSSQPSFTPIFAASTPSKPAEGGFNFKSTFASKTTTASIIGQAPPPAFTLGAKSSSASDLSSGVASTPGNSTGFNFGASSAMKSTNSSDISMTGASKSDFNFGAPSQPSSSAFDIGQSNPPSYLQSTQSGMTFGQSQSTPAFGQTTQAMTGFGQSSSSTPAFGQLNQSSFTPVASNNFGQPNQTNVFGQANQSVPAFGQSSQPAFGQASSQGATTGFQFNSSSTPSFGPSVGGFGQSSQSGLPAFGQNAQQVTPSFAQSETVQQGFNFGGSGITPAPNFGSGGYTATPAPPNTNTFSVGTGGTIARDRKKYAARRKVNKRR